MNDLADKIEQQIYLRYGPWCDIGLERKEWDQIIAALRRGPITKNCLAGDGGCAFPKCECPNQEGYSPTDRQATQNLTRPPSGEMVMVPREPTIAMLEAMGAHDGHVPREKEAFPYQRYHDYYTAMLAAIEGRKP
jgi:hypothetical protein